MSVPDNGHALCIVYLGKWQMRAHLDSIQKDKFTGTGLTLSGGLSSSAAATGFPSHLLFQKVAPSPTKGGVTGAPPATLNLGGLLCLPQWIHMVKVTLSPGYPPSVHLSRTETMQRKSKRDPSSSSYSGSAIDRMLESP